MRLYNCTIIFVTIRPRFFDRITPSKDLILFSFNFFPIFEYKPGPMIDFFTKKGHFFRFPLFRPGSVIEITGKNTSNLIDEMVL